MNETISTEINRTPGRISRISWGAILAGTLTTVALLFLLNLLGLGIGLTTIDPLTESEPFRGLGTGTAIWWILSNVAALFTGGLVAARMSGLPSSLDGALHGFLVWALSLILGVIMLTSAIGGILNGLGNLVSGVVGGDGSGDITAQVEEAMQSGKEQTTNASESIKQQIFDLINTGEEYNILPSDTSEETSELLNDSQKQLKQMNLKNDIESFISDVSFDLDENGNLKITSNGSDEILDAKKIKQTLTENTELSEAEIDGVIKKWQTKLQNTVDKVEQYYAEAKQKVTEYSDKAADAAGKAGIIAFFILLLGGGAAFFGGITGAPDYTVLVDEDRKIRGKTKRVTVK